MALKPLVGGLFAEAAQEKEVPHILPALPRREVGVNGFSHAAIDLEPTVGGRLAKPADESVVVALRDVKLVPWMSEGLLR